MKKFVENIIKCLITIVLSITVVHPVYAMENDSNEVSKPEVQTTSEPLPFHDVGSIDWFYNSVKYVYDNGLMTGLNETTFGPYENLARAQFAVILHRMNGSPDMEYTNKFPDVADNQWYTDAILWANEAGVVGGYTDTGKFGPGDNINREQMAVMMYRYANYLGYDTSARADISKYTDAGNVNEFAKEAVSWAVGEGIITGKYNETQLDPQGNASRAECATIIMRFMENGGGSGDNPEGIAYHEGVEEIHLNYELDTEKRIIVVYDQEMVRDWKEGEIKVLVNEENNELTHAIKIETITRTSDRTTIHYSDPDVNEVVSSVNVNGKEMQNGTITPAEGVEFLNAQSRANIEGSFDAFEEISFKKTIAKGLDLTGSFKIESIDYDLNIKLNWLNTKVNRVYFVVNSKFNAGLHGDVGNIGDKIALAELRIPIAYGAIMIRGTLYAVYNLDGTIDFQWEYTNTTGIDYKKGKLNFVNKNSSGIKEMEMEASLRGGFAIEPGVELFSMDVMTLGAEYGKSFDAKLDVISIDPWKYCLQGDMYSYAKIYGELLPGILDKEFNEELLNKSNAFDLESLHFEETGLVKECTRLGFGYKGQVISKLTKDPLPDAKISLIQDGKEITYTTSNEQGKFNGKGLKAGKYKLVISKNQYLEYLTDIEITDKILDLGIIELEETTGYFKIEGTVYDGLTSNPLSEAIIKDRLTNNEVLSNDDGDFSLYVKEFPANLTITKVGYETREIVINSEDEYYNYYYLYPGNLQENAIIVNEGETVRITQNNYEGYSDEFCIATMSQTAVYDQAHYSKGTFDNVITGSALNDLEQLGNTTPYEEYVNAYNVITVKKGQLMIYDVDNDGNLLPIGQNLSFDKQEKEALVRYEVNSGQTLALDTTHWNDVIYDGTLFQIYSIPGTTGKELTEWHSEDIEDSEEKIEYPYGGTTEMESRIRKLYHCDTGQIILYLPTDDIDNYVKVYYE